MNDSHGNEFIVGNEVAVSGVQDSREFSCEEGVVIAHVASGTHGEYVTIRFDDWQEGHGVEEREWNFYKCDADDWFITQHGQRSVGPSTYLNGLDISFPSADEDAVYLEAGEAILQRPRFMTAWLHGGPETFTTTGDAFLTLEAAEEFARETLENDGREGQIAVFEIRSVHLARLDITSEAA